MPRTSGSGRPRGGLTSKIHLAADSPQFIPVLNNVRGRLPVGRPRTRPTTMAGGKAYSSHANHAHLRKCCNKAVIPERKDRATNR